MTGQREINVIEQFGKETEMNWCVFLEQIDLTDAIERKTESYYEIEIKSHKIGQSDFNGEIQ